MFFTGVNEHHGVTPDFDLADPGNTMVTTTLPLSLGHRPYSRHDIRLPWPDPGAEQTESGPGSRDFHRGGWKSPVLCEVFGNGLDIFQDRR